MNTINPEVTSRQRQIIAGTILGGSSIISPRNGVNCYLSMRDSRLEWIQFKASELSSLASISPFTKEKTYRWHSKCFPIISEFRDMFYSDGKRKINDKTLDLLTDVSFAIWVGDCGYLKNDNLVLNTHVWGDSNDVIMKYFKMLEYKPVLFDEGGRSRIMLDEDGTVDFLQYANPHLPEWMSLRSSGKITNLPKRLSL
jgi:hypothetical protein